MSHPPVHAPAFLQGVTADKAMTWAVIGGVLLVLIVLARTIGRLAKGIRPAPAPAPPKASGGGKGWLLAAAAAGGGLWFYETHHKTAAAPVRGAPAPHPAPAPTPRPTVTQTVAPHITNLHFPLTGNQILIAVAIVAVVGFLITRVVVRNTP